MTISGISNSDVSKLRDQFQQFRSGKANLQKTDLSEIQKMLSAGGASGSKASTGIDNLLTSFDDIDKNKDGISFQELTDFAKSKGLSLPGNEAKTQGKGGHHGGMHRLGKGEFRPVIPGEVQPDAQSDKSVPQSLSKDDLVAMKDKIEKNGQKTLSGLTDLINSFDVADTNKDGQISQQELQNYVKTKESSLTTDVSKAAGQSSGLSSSFDLFAMLNMGSAGSGDQMAKKQGQNSALLQKMIKSYGLSSLSSLGSMKVTA
ncbi:MAG: hypothetical protein HQM09_09930 [Candidatus Riflebacteria bacterium]|nr:hypothetical protein [Candidatus Riflebacteria bacterium]